MRWVEALVRDPCWHQLTLHLVDSAASHGVTSSVERGNQGPGRIAVCGRVAHVREPVS